MRHTLGDFPEDSTLSSATVILVDAKDPRNIGAVARAMGNLGAADLRLVNPARFDVAIARGVACWAKSVLDTARTFVTLEEAVADAHDCVGFASDSGGHRISQLSLPQWVATGESRMGRRSALIFGSEETGLRKEHFPFCHHLIRIPSVAQNRSYNLAQAVLLTLYEMRMNSIPPRVETTLDWPETSQLHAYTHMVLSVAERVGFLGDTSPQHIRDLLFNTSKRGRLTTHELEVMTGLFGMIQKALGKRG